LGAAQSKRAPALPFSKRRAALGAHHGARAAFCLPAALAAALLELRSPHRSRGVVHANPVA
jgi:hypothetical protein